MINPTSVSSTVCSMLMNNLLSEGESQTDSITELTKDTFTNSTDYRPVYKNFNYETQYDSLIYEGNQEDKIAGYKVFQSYPYGKVQFKIGDYIHWDYNRDKYSTWILISLDTEYLYNVKGRMVLCNNQLKWRDSSGELNCYPCAIKDALTYTNFKWGNTGVVQSGGDIVVIVQRNSDTKNINVNDRFIFNSVAFQVKQFFDELNPNYMQLYMRKVSELSDDNLDKNIATNNAQNENTVKINGLTILPIDNEILLGQTVNFNVYNYVNSVQQSDTFTITVEDVPSEYYQLTIVDGNHFNIKNIAQYNKNTMTINCVDNTTQNTVIKKIWLGGNW